MSFEGMNVDQMRGLAKQVDADAQALYNLVNNLNGVLAGLIFTWNGPVAAAFEHEWQHKNRPALLNAYTILTNLHAHLVDNISQQTAASAAEGGWTTGRVASDLDNVKKWVDRGLQPFDLAHQLREKKYDPRTDDSREYKIGFGDHPLLGIREHHITFQLDHGTKLERFFAYHDSPAIRFARDLPFVEKADRFLVHTRLDDFLGPVGVLLALPDIATNLYEGGAALSQGHYNDAIMNLGNIVADTGNPVGLLAGGDIRLLAEDYEMGEKVLNGTEPAYSEKQIFINAGKLTVNAFFG